MALKRRRRTALLASIAASTALHIAVATMLPATGGAGLVPNGNLTGNLEVTISLADRPAEPQQANKENRATVEQMNLAGPREGYSSSHGEQGSAEKEYGIFVEEKPVLRYVREINLEDASDLTEDGFVEVELLISPDGRVLRTSLVSTDIPAEFFELVAQAFADAEFSPGKRNGVPVFQKFRFRTTFGKSYAP